MGYLWVGMASLLGILACSKVTQVIEKGQNEMPLKEKNFLNFLGWQVYWTEEILNYNPPGILQSRIEAHKGIPQGTAIYFTTKGFVKMKGKFKNGKKTGLWTEFYPNTKQVLSRTTYQAGIKEGSFEFLYKNGVRWKKGKYQKGWPVDTLYVYDESGGLQIRSTCWTTSKAGAFESWDKDTDTLVLKYICKGGVKDGLYQSFYREGKIKERGLYKGGKKTGDWKEYWPNSQLKKHIIYTRGRPEGMQIYRYKNGIIQKTGYIQDGKGLLFTWDTTEKLISVDFFKDGFREGWSVVWNGEGYIQRLQRYQRDTLQEHRAFYEHKLLDTQYPLWENSAGKIKNKVKLAKHPQEVAFLVWGRESGGKALWEKYTTNLPPVNSIKGLRQKGSYARGLRQGVWSWYDSLGARVQETTYNAGVQEGWHRLFSSVSHKPYLSLYFIKGREAKGWVHPN